MDVAALKITESSRGVELEVHVKPRAHKSAVKGVQQGVLEVAVAAMPKEGEANDELVRFLAEVLGTAKRNVTIVRGDASRHKRISIAGARAADVARTLQDLADAK